MRTLSSFLASASTARFRPTLSTSSSRSSEANTAPIFTNGPNRPIPASIGSPTLGMDADDPRQRQQAERLLQREAFPVHPARERGATGLALLVLRIRLALLDIESVGTAAHRDRLAGLGMVPEVALTLFQRLAAVLAVLDRETAGVLAGRVVGAADEAPVPPELEAEPAGAAGRALARVAAIGAGREEMRAEVAVQRLDHVGDLEVPGLLDGAGELVPERLHDPAPVRAAAGDVVELLLQARGEPGVDVALEEAGEERRDQPAPVLRHEAAALQPDVVAVAQHGEDAGVRAGPADAQLLHLLDQARLGVSGRRLGEVLLGEDAVGGRPGRAHASAAASGSHPGPRPPAHRPRPRDTA